MVEKNSRSTSGKSALILGVAMALPLTANAQTFGFEESEGRVEHGEAASAQDRREGVGPQERNASVDMAADARKEEQAPAVTLSADILNTPAATVADSDSELDAIVTSVAREAADRVALLDGQSRSRSVVASVDLTERFVIVRLDAGFVPSSYGPAFEDQVSLINNAILHVAEKVEPLRGVRYLYGGYDIHHYFPEVKAADDEARRAGELRRVAVEGVVAGERAVASYGYEDNELIHLLEREASRRVSAHVQANDVLRVIGVNVTMDASRQRILADIGEGYRPEPDGDEMFLQELTVTLRHYAEQAGMAISGVDIHFQGHPLEYYYPDELRVPARALHRSVNQSALVSSGHGLVRVHPHLSWEWQRPDAFGSREDMITPPYGDELQRLLEARSGVTVHRARSRSLARP